MALLLDTPCANAAPLRRDGTIRRQAHAIAARELCARGRFVADLDVCRLPALDAARERAAGLCAAGWSLRGGR